MFTPKNLVVVALIVLAVSLVYGVARLTYYVHVSRRVVDESRPYEQSPDSQDKSILFIGDSTAVGIGASDPRNSVAGRLGQDFPAARIVNRAESGMKSGELLERLDVILSEEKHDLIVIHVGANDILRMNSLRGTQHNLREIVERCTASAENVALFTSGDIGSSDLIPWFARKLMSRRSLMLRNYTLELESDIEKLHYIDLYHKEADLPDSQFYADDRLHLSDDGYGFWFRELKSVLLKDTDLYGA